MKGEAMPPSQDERNRESRVRRRFAQAGLPIAKDRAWSPDTLRSLAHQGGFMVVRADAGWIVAGERYALTLDELEGMAQEL
jgi:hypothetical protein